MFFFQSRSDFDAVLTGFTILIEKILFLTRFFLNEVDVLKIIFITYNDKLTKFNFFFFSIQLRKKMSKNSQVRRSKWHIQPLNDAQKLYAATDAYVSLIIIYIVLIKLI